MKQFSKQQLKLQREIEEMLEKKEIEESNYIIPKPLSAREKQLQQEFFDKQKICVNFPLSQLFERR